MGCQQGQWGLEPRRGAPAAALSGVHTWPRRSRTVMSAPPRPGPGTFVRERAGNKASSAFLSADSRPARSAPPQRAALPKIGCEARAGRGLPPAGPPPGWAPRPEVYQNGHEREKGDREWAPTVRDAGSGLGVNACSLSLSLSIIHVAMLQRRL